MGECFIMTRAGHDRRFWAQVGVIALGAFAIRMLIRLFVGVDDYWINGYTQYSDIASSLVQGHGYAFPGDPATAFRVPLYSLFIAAITGGPQNVWALIAVQSALSAATAVFAGLITRRMAGTAAGLIAAALYAAWPYAAWHDVSLQESGLFAFLSALATWLLIEAHARQSPILAGGVGLVLGLALLTRSTLVPFAVIGVLSLCLPTGRDEPAHRRLSQPVLAAAVLLLTLAPWLHYAHRVTGRYGLGTEGGSSLYAGNHALTFSAYPERSIDESRALIFSTMRAKDNAELAVIGSDEARQSDWYRDRAIETIFSDPLAFARGGVIKLWAAFGPLPSPRHGTVANLGYAAGWVSFFGLALTGMWLRRRRWRDDLLLYAHFATFAGVSVLIWAHTAHRSYLDFVIAVFAGVALAALMPQHWRARLEAQQKGE